MEVNVRLSPLDTVAGAHLELRERTASTMSMSASPTLAFTANALMASTDTPANVILVLQVPIATQRLMSVPAPPVKTVVHARTGLPDTNATAPAGFMVQLVPLM